MECEDNDHPQRDCARSMDFAIYLQIWPICHSGLDPESIVITTGYLSGCRIKSGMTRTNLMLFELRHSLRAGG